MSTLLDRFFLADWPTDGLILLEGDEAKHAARVRRLGPGDRVELFDGRGRSLLGAIRNVSSRSIAVEREQERDDDRLPPRVVTIATAPPKGERLDWLVEKATELGVRRLLLLKTERSVVDPRIAKVERLRRLAVEACKQSGRNRLLEIEGPIAWSQCSIGNLEGIKLICDPSGASIQEIHTQLAGEFSSSSPLTFAIGPEGGFSDREAESARENGWRSVRLAPTILRVETAALTAAALALAYA